VSDESVLLATSSMHARRSPWAIVGVWGWQTMFALVVDWPGVSLVRIAYGSDPRGDAPLWAAGSHALLDFLWHEGHGAIAAARGASVLLLFGAFAGLLPTAALMIAIAYATHSRRVLGVGRTMERALRAVPSMALMLVVIGVAQALAFAAAWATADVVAAWAHSGLGEARAQLLGATLALAFILGALALGVVRDLAQAAVVRLRLTAFRSLALAARLFRRTPISLCWSWTWRALASLLPIAVAAAFAASAGGRGGTMLVVFALVHQAVVLARVALRASWLALALRSLDGDSKVDVPDDALIA
jgi:hypothetical protein